MGSGTARPASRCHRPPSADHPLEKLSWLDPIIPAKPNDRRQKQIQKVDEHRRRAYSGEHGDPTMPMATTITASYGNGKFSDSADSYECLDT